MDAMSDAMTDEKGQGMLAGFATKMSKAGF
jgi:hypothetical protein